MEEDLECSQLGCGIRKGFCEDVLLYPSPRLTQVKRGGRWNDIADIGSGWAKGCK